MTLTNLIRFLKIAYSGLAPQIFYLVGVCCLWLYGFQTVVYVREAAYLFLNYSAPFIDDWNFIGFSSDTLIVSGHFTDSTVTTSQHFIDTFQSYLRWYRWNIYTTPGFNREGHEGLTFFTYEQMKDKERVKNNVTNGGRITSHSFFFLSTELFGKVKISQHYKWAYFGFNGGQYSLWDEFEDHIVDPRLATNTSRYSVEYIRYNLTYFFTDPLHHRELYNAYWDYDENYITNTMPFAFVGFFFLNAIRNDYWIISSDYFLFRHMTRI